MTHVSRQSDTFHATAVAGHVQPSPTFKQEAFSGTLLKWDEVAKSVLKGGYWWRHIRLEPPSDRRFGTSFPSSSPGTTGINKVPLAAWSNSLSKT